MPKSIYNEGRVVGYSAYEVYVKQHAEVDPDTPPATEREWLASSLAMGTSMLLKIPAEAVSVKGPHNVEIKFPAKTAICAANCIIANLFSGKGYYASGNNWARKITEYSPLIQNDATKSPNGSTIPQKTAADWEEAQRKGLVDYMRIIDGVVLQPGNWVDNTSKPPQKDFSPDLKGVPILRLLVSDRIEHDIEVLFTGFSLRSVVSGEVVLESAVNTLDPDSGDFLGPGAFPWANKIFFTVPTSAINYLFLDKYRRKIPNTDTTSVKVDDTAVVDMRKTNPGTYYTSVHTDSRVPITVDEFNSTGPGDAVITVYQKPSASGRYTYPPAAWGTYVTSKGGNWLHPLDVVAPGTVKMFDSTGDDAQDQAQLQDYENTFPGGFGMVRDPDGEISSLDQDGIIQKVAKVAIEPLKNSSGTEIGKILAVQTGKHIGRALAVHTAIDGAQKTITTSSASSETVTLTHINESGGKDTSGYSAKATKAPVNAIDPLSDEIMWDDLMKAFKENNAIDLLGQALRMFKTGMEKANYPYIQFKNGLRLYISNHKPTDGDVPVGSIGIGWSDESQGL